MAYRLLLFGFVSVVPATSFAIDWSGSSSQDWSEGINWVGGAKPASNDPVNGDDATIEVDFFDNFPIIDTPGELARTVIVGSSFPGDLEITSGGELSAVEMIVGQDFGGLGGLELSGGTLNLSQNLSVGVGEFAIVSQSGGTIASVRNVIVGVENFGSYLLENGSIHVTGEDFVVSLNSDSAGSTFDQEGGEVTARDFSVGHNFESDGTVTLLDGTVSLTRNLIVGREGTGIFTQNGGTITVGGNVMLTDGSASASASYSLQNGVLDLTGGDVLFNSGVTSFALEGGRLEDVSLFGASLLNDGGTMVPGGSVGSTTIAGSYTQTALGTYEVEVDGASRASDQIQVQGVATLDGILTITVLSQFNTIKDQSLVILAASAGVLGNFASLPEIADGRGAGHLGDGVFFSGISVNPTDVRVDLFQALEGDRDGDADVDITDFNGLAVGFDPQGANRTTNDWTHGDFDGDADVDITDFNFLAVNFNGSEYGTTVSPIPEPASIVLVMLGIALTSTVRRPREVAP